MRPNRHLFCDSHGFKRSRWLAVDHCKEIKLVQDALDGKRRGALDLERDHGIFEAVAVDILEDHLGGFGYFLVELD